MITRLSCRTGKSMSIAILVAAVVAVQIFSPLWAPRAHAFVPTVPTTTNPKPNLLASSDSFKEYILDLAARISVGVIITALTNQVIGWIQGDDGSNVGFVANLDEAFRKEANLAGGEFLNNLAGIDLCTASLRGYLNVSLRTPGIQQRLGCTLSGIGANAEEFFSDFSKGGWPAFLKIGLEPQNNPYGAYLIALDSKLALEDAAGRRVALGFQAGQGFLGGRGAVRKCEKKYFEDEAGVGDYSTVCNTEYNTKTPGGLVADTLSKTVNIGYDFAVVSDEIDEAITAIANTLINKLVSSTYSLINSQTGEEETGEGVFNTEAANLSFGAAELTGSSIPRHADAMLFTADTGHAALDQIISATSRALFITRRQIADITASAEPLTAAQQAQLAALRQTEAQQEAKLIIAFTLKNQLLETRSKILGLKQAFQTAITAEDITNAANNIEQIAQDLNNVMQNIESLDIEISVPLPPIPVGNVKQDTATELRNATLHISSATSLLREMQAEVRRLAILASTTPQRKIELDAKSKDIDTEVIRLGESRTAIAGARTALERATTPGEITTAIRNAITEMLATLGELQRANTLMTTIVPLLKPE